jgi:hypothetical protein
MRATLLCVKEEHRNVTLSLPRETLRRAKVLAVNRGTSLSGLLRELLDDLLAREGGYAAARRRGLRRLRDGADLGTGGRIGWTREQLHQR